MQFYAHRSTDARWQLRPKGSSAGARAALLLYQPSSTGAREVLGGDPTVGGGGRGEGGGKN